MKHYKEVTSTSRVLAKTTCDVCKEEIVPEGSYRVEEIEVRHRTGKSYPEGGCGTELDLDICPHCWKNHFLPFLFNLGCENYKDWDY